MAGRVSQAHLLVLALDFDQQGANAPQQANADRMIIDKRPRPAVLGDDPAQHDVVGGGQPMLIQDRGDSVVFRQRKACGHARLLSGFTHQSAFRPGAEGQTKTIQKDRLSGAGFTRQHGQPLIEIQIQPFDQDDVAD